MKVGVRRSKQIDEPVCQPGVCFKCKQVKFKSYFIGSKFLSAFIMILMEKKNKTITAKNDTLFIMNDIDGFVLAYLTLKHTCMNFYQV